MKGKLRQQYAELRNGISDKLKKDSVIAASFLNSDFYKGADEILCYYPIKSEIGTLEIISKAIEDGKKLLLPVCHENKGVMQFYRIKDFTELKSGKYGIQEPDTEKCKALDCFTNAVCIVPAYAYDLRGFRLGYGGGYYDRFLADFKFTTIGLCYDELVADVLPKDKFDIKVDYIITDMRVIKTTEED